MLRIDEKPIVDRQILTRRQSLLSRPGVWVGLAACVCLLLGGLLFWRPLNPFDTEAVPSLQADGENVLQQTRLLQVATSPLSTAGPTFLSQEFTGVVVPRRSSRLAAKVVGRVVSVLVDLGDRVSEGQVLLELDHAELDGLRGVAEASLASAKSRLQELESGPRALEIEQARARVSELEAGLQLKQANYIRTSRLRNSSKTEQELDEAKFAVEAADAQRAAAQHALGLLLEGTRSEQLEIQRATVSGLESELSRIAADLADRTVFAPFSGYINARSLDEGSIVSPGQALLEIVEGAPYDIRVGLPSELDVQVLAGDVRVTFEGQVLQATLDRFSPTIDEITRTREVVLRLDDSTSQLVSPGTAVSISVRTRVQGPGYWLPTRCLTSGARGLWAVYVAIPQPNGESTPDGRHLIERRQVELLRSHGDWSEIQGPLAPNELLVIAGAHRVTAGQIVQCVRFTGGSLEAEGYPVHSTMKVQADTNSADD